MTRRLTTTALAFGLGLAGLSPVIAAPTADAVVASYADLGRAMYEDALAGAKALQTAVDAFLAAPTPETLAAARKAWIEARPWYQQTEGFRFGNKAVDALEGKVNAWPLDEGLIDYVDVARYGETSEENPLYRANVIAQPKIRVGKTRIDATRITKTLLAERLQEAGGVEANVATGWHAIEFLLWGQDLNGTGPGAGNRPASDFDTKACSHGHCDRRRAYLKAATDLLVDDLAEMAALWADEGKARKALKKASANEGLATIFIGLGSLSYGDRKSTRLNSSHRLTSRMPSSA
jgi:putative iron-regulated protein